MLIKSNSYPQRQEGIKRYRLKQTNFDTGENTIDKLSSIINDNHSKEFLIYVKSYIYVRDKDT